MDRGADGALAKGDCAGAWGGSLSGAGGEGRQGGSDIARPSDRYGRSDAANGGKLSDTETCGPFHLPQGKSGGIGGALGGESSQPPFRL